MANDSDDLIRRAHKGETDAIAALLNRSFKKDRIQVKVEQMDTVLRVLLQGEALPKNPLVKRVYQGMIRLRPARLETVTIYGQVTDSTAIAWSKTIALPSPKKSTAQGLQGVEKTQQLKSSLPSVPKINTDPRNTTRTVNNAANNTGASASSTAPRPNPSQPIRIESLTAESLRKWGKVLIQKLRNSPQSFEEGIERLGIWLLIFWAGIPIAVRIITSPISFSASYLSITDFSQTIPTAIGQLTILLFVGVVALVPVCFQESVALVSRYTIRPTYLEGLGINCLGVTLANLLLNPILVWLKLEFLSFLITASVYYLFVPNLGFIRSIAAVILMMFILYISLVMTVSFFLLTI